VVRSNLGISQHKSSSTAAKPFPSFFADFFASEKQTGLLLRVFRDVSQTQSIDATAAD
jgi:hypothetical protein